MFLADINLWLALAFRSHIHHESGKNWFKGLSNDSCAFCRLTQQGFLRLATNPKAFGAEAVSMSDAWRMFDEFLGDPVFPSRTSPRTSSRSGGATRSAGPFLPKSGATRTS